MSILYYGLEGPEQTRVCFPFQEPYLIQKTYMQKVIQCLDNVGINYTVYVIYSKY